MSDSPQGTIVSPDESTKESSVPSQQPKDSTLTTDLLMDEAVVSNGLSDLDVSNSIVNTTSDSAATPSIVITDEASPTGVLVNMDAPSLTSDTAPTDQVVVADEVNIVEKSEISTILDDKVESNGDVNADLLISVEDKPTAQPLIITDDALKSEQPKADNQVDVTVEENKAVVEDLLTNFEDKCESAVVDSATELSNVVAEIGETLGLETEQQLLVDVDGSSKPVDEVTAPTSGAGDSVDVLALQTDEAVVESAVSLLNDLKVDVGGNNNEAVSAMDDKRPGDDNNDKISDKQDESVTGDSPPLSPMSSTDGMIIHGEDISNDEGVDVSPVNGDHRGEINGECDQKVDDLEMLGQLHLDSIKNRFEETVAQANKSGGAKTVADRSALSRSESIAKRMEKYQSVVTGKANQDSDESSQSDSEEEVDGVVKARKPKKENMSFAGLSQLKSQWEKGVDGQDRPGETKDELAKLRKKICLGRSESMRQVYEKAVSDANTMAVKESRLPEDVVPEVQAQQLRHKFEAGQVHDVEEERLEQLRRDKEDDLSVFQETGIAHEAKNIFRQLDKEVQKGPQQPPLVSSKSRSDLSSRWQVPVKAPASGEVVKGSDPCAKDDVVIEAAELTERFKFFENYKDDSGPKKRFEMTPPRENGQALVVENEPIRDPEVVRCSTQVEEIPKTDTARKMREKFREMESVSRQSVDMIEGPPKPLKRITPPRDDDKSVLVREPMELDPSVVRCSYKSEDVIPVEPEKAKSMRQKFENWNEQVEAENRKNGNHNGQSHAEPEEDYLPQADMAKTLRAKFEAIKEQDSAAKERPRAKPGRFVEFPGTPESDACSICEKKIYPMERMEASGLRLHKNCFRCQHCACHLRLENYTVSGGKLYCTPHFRQFFIAKGNYDEGFGREKWSRSVSPGNPTSAAGNPAQQNGGDQPCVA